MMSFKSKQDVGQFGLSHLIFSPFRVVIQTQDPLFWLEIKADDCARVFSHSELEIPAHEADTLMIGRVLMTTISRAHGFRVCLGDVVLCDMSGS